MIYKFLMVGILAGHWSPAWAKGEKCTDLPPVTCENFQEQLSCLKQLHKEGKEYRAGDMDDVARALEEFNSTFLEFEGKILPPGSSQPIRELSDSLTAAQGEYRTFLATIDRRFDEIVQQAAKCLPKK